MTNPRYANGHQRRRLRARILREEHHCGICGNPVDKTLPAPHPDCPEIDEITPLARGGDPLARANTQLAHRPHLQPMQRRRNPQRLLSPLQTNPPTRIHHHPHLVKTDGGLTMARTYNRDSRGRFASTGGSRSAGKGKSKGGSKGVARDALGYPVPAWMQAIKPASADGGRAAYKAARKNPVATFGTQKSKASKAARRRAGYKVR